MRADYQVMDWRPGLNFSGLSASAILDHLASKHHHHDEDDEVDDNDDGHDYDSNMSSWSTRLKKRKKVTVVTQDDDDKIGFSNGGLELYYDEVEDGWSLVGVVWWSYGIQCCYFVFLIKVMAEECGMYLNSS